MTLGEIQNPEENQIAGATDNAPTTEVIKSAYEEADRKLIEFVNKNIELMREHLLSAEIPDIQHVNKCYIDYMPVSISLNRLYQKVKLDASRAKEELEFFDDQAMDETKRELNREDNKKVWYSATELKAAAHTKYKAKYAQLLAKADLAEGRRSFIERLCRAWDAWQFGLGQISRNLIAEANANGLDMKAQGMMPADPDDGNMERLVDQALNGGFPLNS